MKSDFWELVSTKDEVIRKISVWAMSHTDLVDLVDIDINYLRIRVIPDYIIPEFPHYQGLLKPWFSDQDANPMAGYYEDSVYRLLRFGNNVIKADFNEFSPIYINLNNCQICTLVTDGSTGREILMVGLSPTNFAKIRLNPEIFPKFVRIGYLHEKDTHNYT